MPINKAASFSFVTFDGSFSPALFAAFDSFACFKKLEKKTSTKGTIRSMGQGGSRHKAEPRKRVAVVGAGLVGVHVAREFALRGYDVTVFDRNWEVGGIATKYDIGVVGGKYRPRVTELCAASELLRAYIFTDSNRALVSQDVPWLDAISPPVLKWAWARMQSYWRTPAQRIGDLGNRLAEESRAAMSRCLTAYPELHSAINQESSYASSLRLEGELWDCQECAPSFTIQPELWTKLVAARIKKELGVKFCLDTTVKHLGLVMSEGAENAASITVQAKDKPNEKVNFDFVVLASSGAAAKLSFWSYPVPVLCMRAYGVEFPASHPSFSKLLPPKGTWANITPDGWLRLMRAWTPQQWQVLSNNKATPEFVPTTWRMCGLLSLGDTYTSRRRDTKALLELLSSRLRVSTQLKDAHLDSEANVRPFAFYRGFTADGLPILSRLGNASNVYLCVGLGDDRTLWGAGCASILAQMFSGEIHIEEKNPFAMSRFHCYRKYDAFSRDADRSLIDWSFDVGMRMARAGQWIDSITEGMLEKSVSPGFLTSSTMF